MDKYQKVLLETDKTSVFFSCTSKKNCTLLDGGFDYENNIYTLTQEEDIFATKYEFVIKTNSNIETCTFLVNGEWQNAIRKGTAFSIELDFENRIEKVKLTFLDNIVDDYVFSVEYVEADKELYYQKQESERKANLLSSAQIKHSTSSDLVNIYFQPCCDKYEYTEILLYIPKEEIVKGWTGDGRKVVEIPSWSMIKKCKVPAEDFYKSINGLAPGTYSFVIKQYDKKDELLMETEHIEFQIKAPKPQFMGRVNRI